MSEIDETVRQQLEVIEALRETGRFEGMSFEGTMDGYIMMSTGDHAHRRIRHGFARQIEPNVPDRWEVDTDQEFQAKSGYGRVPDLFVAAIDEVAPMLGPRAASFSGVKMTLEVTSKSTRKVDLEDKVRDYGMSGVPVYVIVDRKTAGILVYSDPGPLGYSEPEKYTVGDEVWLPAPIGLTVQTEFVKEHLQEDH